MTKTTPKILARDEAWENEELGADEAFAEPAPAELQAAVDDALDLQMISIRLQKELISDLKMIATLNGIGYQPLIRQVLKRFVDSEIRILVRDHLDRQTKKAAMDAALEAKDAAEHSGAEGHPPAEQRRRKAA